SSGSGRLLVVVDFLEVGIDNVVLGRRVAARGLGLGLGLALLVHGLAQLHRGFRQGIGLFLDRLGVVALDDALQIGDGGLDGRLVLGRDLVAIVLERLLG